MLVSGLLILNLLPNSTTRLRDEADQLREVLTYMGDYARLSGHRYLWSADGDGQGYTIKQWSHDGRWLSPTLSATVADILRPHRFTGEVKILESARAGEKLLQAQLIFNPSGINDLFTITLSINNRPDQQIILQSDPLGKVMKIDQPLAHPSMSQP